MKRTLFGVALLLSGLVPAVVAAPFDFSRNPIEETEYNSAHSMGCMLLQECTEGVVEINSVQDLKDYYGDYDVLPAEFQQLLDVLGEIGIKVYIAPDRYFLSGTRGVYHTVSNNFYLNDMYMVKKHHLMSVMRHEGWHAAQDCMAGSIDNTFIAVIRNSDDIPQIWKDMAADVYPANALPWEQEATWAGREEGMTLNALQACASDTPMWEQIEPTPLTRQFLVDKGYIK
tara:strand:- start:173 stop:859 length:687 start_codon:yes stop_codon:yes gene_type:complete